jgi:hypothetical protein
MPLRCVVATLVLAMMGAGVARVRGASAADAGSRTHVPTVAAPITVAIVVDQLAAWVLRERIDQLPSDGGFARLQREGRYFPEMAYDHAITETAPGHASLFTGKVPREHGIVANDLWVKGKKVATIADASVPLIGLDGKVVGGVGSSLAKLDDPADLVASAFRARFPKGQGIVAALSLKDRGALFAAGPDADYAIWFDAKQPGSADTRRERGAFVTTQRYSAALAQSGLAAFVRGYRAAESGDSRDGIERLEDAVWVGQSPRWLFAHAGLPVAGDYLGFVASHTAGQAPKPGAAFRALPESDRLLMEMAVHILRREPSTLPVFLSLSLSANDYVGHMFGPDSWEAWDELYRLDADLAWLFRELDSFGGRTWSVVLTADHGVVPVENDPRRPTCARSPRAALESGRACAGARGARLFTDEVRHAADSAANALAKRGKLGKLELPAATGAATVPVVSGVVYPYIYLTPAAHAAIAVDAKARQRLADALDGALRKRWKGIEGVVDVEAFRRSPACPDGHTRTRDALVCHSISSKPELGGDFYVVVAPGAFFDADLVPGSGTGHGSPYGYDRFVPLLVRDGGRPELAGSLESKRVSFTRFHDELLSIALRAPSPSGSP